MKKYHSYIPLTEDYCYQLDELDFAIKTGYEINYKGRTYERQTTPYDLKVYTLDDKVIVLDVDWAGYDGGHDIKGVYLAIEETKEDYTARLGREEAKAQKEREKKAQERADKKVEKKNQLESALKLLEKSGYKVSK